MHVCINPRQSLLLILPCHLWHLVSPQRLTVLNWLTKVNASADNCIAVADMATTTRTALLVPKQTHLHHDGRVFLPLKFAYTEETFNM